MGRASSSSSNGRLKYGLMSWFLPGRSHFRAAIRGGRAGGRTSAVAARIKEQFISAPEIACRALKVDLLLGAVAAAAVAYPLRFV